MTTSGKGTTSYPNHIDHVPSNAMVFGSNLYLSSPPSSVAATLSGNVVPSVDVSSLPPG